MNRKAILSVIAAAIGALIAYIIDTSIKSALAANDTLLIVYKEGTTNGLRLSEVINAAIGIALVILGPKIFSYARYIGLGWATVVIGGELVELYNVSTAPPPPE